MNNIKIADLKAHLSEHLRRVRRGEVLTILDRTTRDPRLHALDQSFDIALQAWPQLRDNLAG